MIILDADKEGFLRSERSLIQTIGRASRHVNGTVSVCMYVCMYVCVYIYIYTQTIGRASRQVNGTVSACMYVCMYVCMYADYWESITTCDWNSECMYVYI